MSSGRKTVQPWLCIGSCMSHHQLSMCTSTPRYSESSLSLKLYLHSFLLRAYETVYESDKEIYGEPTLSTTPLTDMQDLEDWLTTLSARSARLGNWFICINIINGCFVISINLISSTCLSSNTEILTVHGAEVFEVWLSISSRQHDLVCRMNHRISGWHHDIVITTLTFYILHSQLWDPRTNIFP